MSKKRNYKSRSKTSGSPAATSTVKAADINVQSVLNSGLLMEDAGRIAFTNPLTGTIDRSNGVETPIPGIGVVNYTPTYGVSNASTSPLNIASRNVYSFVRKHNSGSANYDSPDLMLYLMAMDSVYTFYMYLTSIYGSMFTFNQKNRFRNGTLCEAIGGDFTDLQANMADFAYYIDYFAVRASTFCVPASMPIYQEHLKYMTAAFADSESPKGQIYVFRPSSYYTFDEFSGAGKLVRHDMPTHLSFQQLREIGESILNPMVISQDMNIMSGDILKAYGEESLVKIQPMDQGYALPIVYDYSVNEALRNARIVGPMRAGFGDITQTVTDQDSYLVVNYSTTPEQGAIPEETAVELANEYAKLNVIISSHEESPEPSKVIALTQWTPVLFATEGNKVFAMKEVGTILINSIKYTNDPSYVGGLSTRTMAAPYFFMPTSTFTVSDKVYLTNFLQFMQFTDFPRLEVFLDVLGSANYLGLYGDVLNYTTVTDDVLTKVHSARMLASYGIPK